MTITENPPNSSDNVMDVAQEQLARTYAKSFLAATDGLDQKSLVEELDSLVVDVLDKFSEFDFNLTSDFLSHDDRVDLIDGVLQGRASGPVINLLKVLSENHRNGALRAVVRMARKLYGESQGRHEVRVYVPQQLSNELQQELRLALQSKLGVEPDFFFHVNPDLIGGMLIQVGDTVYDGSVRTTLERARQRMVLSAIEAIESGPDKFVTGAENLGEDSPNNQP